MPGRSLRRREPDLDHWAMRGPLASGDEDTGCAVILVPVATFGLDVGVDRARDPFVGPSRLMLVNHRGAIADKYPARPVRRPRACY